MTTSSTASLSEALLNDLRVEGAVVARLCPGPAYSLICESGRRPILHVVLAGATTIHLADGQPRELVAGDCALVFYGDRHRLGNARQSVPIAIPPWQVDALPDRPFDLLPTTEAARSGEADIISFALTLAYLPNSAFANRAAPPLWVTRLVDAPPTLPPRAVFDSRTVEAMYGPGGSAVATMLAGCLFTLALREISIAVWEGELRDVRAPNTRRIAAIRRELRVGLSQDWDVARMARSVGLSRSTFAETFTAITGMAPMAYLTRERMLRAAQLLRAGTLSMQEVGQRVGYTVESSFARAFKRYWGVAPRDFPPPSPGGE